MVIGFWNIDNKGKKAQVDMSEYLISFVREKSIDILILAEAGDITVPMFQQRLGNSFKQLSSGRTNIILLSRYSVNCFTDKTNLYKSKRWLIYNIEIPNIIRFNLASVHFPSKLNWGKESLALECVNFSRDIAIVEEETNCYETILIGDFNMNPFEDGLVAANGLNAIQDLTYVSERPDGRNIDGTNYTYFYNPMWNFFGDYKKPYGTYYYRPSGHISQEWNIYDQVMFRESIKKHLSKEYVNIIDTIGGENLTRTFERPDRDSYSDHLPIVFKLTPNINEKQK